MIRALSKLLLWAVLLTSCASTALPSPSGQASPVATPRPSDIVTSPPRSFQRVSPTLMIGYSPKGTGNLQINMTGIYNVIAIYPELHQVLFLVGGVSTMESTVTDGILAESIPEGPSDVMSAQLMAAIYRQTHSGNPTAEFTAQVVADAAVQALHCKSDADYREHHAMDQTLSPDEYGQLLQALCGQRFLLKMQTPNSAK